MVDSSIDCDSTCDYSLTLRITVLPFSSVREDSTVHCTLQCTIQGWRERECGDVCVWGGRYKVGSLCICTAKK